MAKLDKIEKKNAKKAKKRKNREREARLKSLSFMVAMRVCVLYVLCEHVCLCCVQCLLWSQYACVLCEHVCVCVVCTLSFVAAIRVCFV